MMMVEASDAGAGNEGGETTAGTQSYPLLPSGVFYNDLDYGLTQGYVFSVLTVKGPLNAEELLASDERYADLKSEEFTLDPGRGYTKDEMPLVPAGIYEFNFSITEDSGYGYDAEEPLVLNFEDAVHQHLQLLVAETLDLSVNSTGSSPRTSHYYRKVRLLKVDVDIVHPASGELSDAAEDANTGSGIVAIKRDDETPVTKLKIHAADSLSNGSKVKLLFVNGSGENLRYRIWKNADFTDEVLSSTTELDATIETTLFIEGLKKSSGGESSEKITQIYDLGSTSFEGDSVRFTVVEAEFDVWLNVFIPIQWTDIPTIHPVHLDTIFTPLPTPWFNRKIAKGDDREYNTIFFDDPASDVDDVAAGTASRAHMQLTVIPFSELDADGIKDGTFIKKIGRSFNYDKSESVPKPGDPYLYDGSNRLFENPVVTSQDTEAGAGLDDPKDTIQWIDSGQRSVRFKLKGGTPNPLVALAPAIDWDFDIGILVDGLNITNPEWKVYGNEQDGFPAYEIYVRDSDGNSGDERGTIMYQYDPFDFGRTPSELFDGWWWGVIDEPVLIEGGEIQ
jgi:hypothetical protein